MSFEQDAGSLRSVLVTGPRCRRVSAVVDPREDEKRAAAEAAAQEIEDGMAVGLGPGSTVAYFLPILAARGLDLRCVATSVATEELARALGLSVQSFDLLDRLAVAVDRPHQGPSD